MQSGQLHASLLFVLNEIALRSYLYSDKNASGEARKQTLLSSAVFEEGLLSFYRLLHQPTSPEFLEEQDWILSDNNTDLPFSFLNLCKEFGFETISLRDALMKLKVSRLQEQKPAAE